MTRILTISGATALTLAVSGVTVVGWAGPPVAGPDPLDRIHRQPVSWTTCQAGPDDSAGQALDQAGARCAEIQVPLDYRDPGGRTITVAMSRLAATDTRHRLGVLLVNGGGPGGPGLPMPPGIRATMGAVGARYDIVGMDPRGIGRSTPVDCRWPTGVYQRSAGSDRAAFDRIAGFQAELARRCALYGGDTLPYLTTRNTARDMDVVRAVLAEPRISYLGQSYGTYLGAAYTAMFPDRTDRVVLDGPVNPLTYAATAQAVRGPVLEKALWDWAGWAAARHRTYRLGRTAAQVVGTVRRILRAAARSPLRVGEYRVDEHLVPVMLSAGLGDDRDPASVSLAETVRVLAGAAAGATVEPTAELERQLPFLLTGLMSEYGSAQAAIICGDAAVPRDADRYWRQVQRARATQPVFGPLVNNVTPCAFWPGTPVEAPVRRPGDVPALIVAATGDPATVYPDGITLRRLMPRSRLVTVPGRIHVSYGHYGNGCTDRIVNAYLAGGRLPASDVRCSASGPSDR